MQTKINFSKEILDKLIKQTKPRTVPTIFKSHIETYLNLNTGKEKDELSEIKISFCCESKDYQLIGISEKIMKEKYKAKIDYLTLFEELDQESIKDSSSQISNNSSNSSNLNKSNKEKKLSQSNLITKIGGHQIEYSFKHFSN